MAKKKRGSFKGKVSKDTQRQQSQASSYGHLKLPKGVQVFKEEPNTKVLLDFMPYEVTDVRHIDRDEEYDIAVPGELWYKRPYDLHRNVGPTNTSEPCPGSIGKKCPICEYRAKMLKEGALWSDEDVKALKPSRRNVYVVIPKKNKDYKEEPHIWDISQFLFQNQLNEEIAEDEAYGVFPDLEEGLTLRIRFSEEVIGKNKFAETSRIDFREREEPYPESILKKIPNLDEMIEFKSYSELEAMLFGQLDPDEIEDDDDIVDEDSKPKRKPSKAKAKSKAVVQDDDDDDDDDDDYDDEEITPDHLSEDFEEFGEDDDEEGLGNRLMREAEENKTKAKLARKAPAKKAVVQEEEEEDDEEEDDLVECVACEGTGKNSKGKRCPICKGTGEVEPSDEEEVDEEEDIDDDEDEIDDVGDDDEVQPAEEDSEDDDEEDEEPVKPTRKKPATKAKAAPKKAPASKKKKTGENTCPHGHEFGTDCEEYDECDECEKWEECLDAQG